jgi:hypothetical protein
MEGREKPVEMGEATAAGTAWQNAVPAIDPRVRSSGRAIVMGAFRTNFGAAGSRLVWRRLRSGLGR